MIKNWLKSKLSSMLLKYILITSSFFTFIGTLVQVYIDYSGDLNTINKTLTQIEKSYSSSLANSLWHLDNDQIEILLSGILKLRDIEYIKIVENKSNGENVFMEMGNKKIQKSIEFKFPLHYAKEQSNTIGHVVVLANLEYLYQRIMDKILIVLATQTVKTFLVSFIILYLIYITVARKILIISKYAEDLTHKNIDLELIIKRNPVDEVNEIDDLILSLNRMRLNLKNYIKNRDDAEKQLKEYKAHLEDLVLKRTKQLNDKNTLLESKIEEIEKMQGQLISQEKLASLGNLTSGIAHEINNPLNFVINFAQVSKMSLDELKEKLKINLNNTGISKEEKQDIDNEIEDIDKMLIEINLHGKRAEQIVKSMLSHSRSSELDTKELNDINNIIEENLNFAFHAMRAKYRGFTVNIEKDFDRSLAPILISAPDIARVFLNIFSNAFYSIIKKSELIENGYSPELIIRTKKVGDYIEIYIRDNGLGISKIALEKLFSPFFTTKPTGEGTGLGLSISHDIICGLHSGKIKADGAEGDFAEFTILLPV